MTNDSQPQGGKEQIKRQLKAMIRAGRYPVGARLPSSRDLAAALGVNRNTTWAAYRELAAEGFVTSSPGRGTVVMAGRQKPGAETLDQAFEKLLARAKNLGFSREELAEHFNAFMENRGSEPAGSILVVECNQEGLDHICLTLRRHFNVNASGVLIQDLEKQGAGMVLAGDFDLIVCGFNHLAELKNVLGDTPATMVGLMLRPDIKAMSELLSQPAGKTVGMVCATNRSTKSLFKEALLADAKHLRRIWASYQDEEGLKRLLATCDVVYASSYVFPRVKALAPDQARVKPVELTLDPAGLELVAQYLKEIGKAKAS